MKIILSMAMMILSYSVVAQKTDDKELVEKAILNYVEAFYEADTSKAYESIVRDIAKRGFFVRDGKIMDAKMSFEQLIRLSQRWKNSQKITAESPKKITVFEILDKTASAKVEAQWGIDFFHLAKMEGQWMIIQVLWQDYPSDKK